MRIRKLIQANYLGEDIVARALSRQAIEDVFLRIVDPLDKIPAPANYKDLDRLFYLSILQKHWPHVAAK